jgi:hypothetical protein
MNTKKTLQITVSIELPRFESEPIPLAFEDAMTDIAYEILSESEDFNRLLFNVNEDTVKSNFTVKSKVVENRPTCCGRCFK